VECIGENVLTTRALLRQEYAAEDARNCKHCRRGASRNGHDSHAVYQAEYRLSVTEQVREEKLACECDHKVTLLCEDARSTTAKLPRPPRRPKLRSVLDRDGILSCATYKATYCNEVRRRIEVL
jgi:hypothetical protein